MNRVLIAMAGLSGMLASPVLGQTVSVDSTQLFDLAAKAETSGHVADAEAMLRALTNDPEDQIATEAHFRLAKLLERTGRKSDAAVLLRRVVDDHPDAAPARLELAALLSTMGEEDRARAELRALRAGALPPEVASFVDKVSTALRARKPFGGTMKVGLLADSNVNRATRSDTLGTIIGDFTLSDDAKATSGRGLSTEGQAFARLPLGRHALVATVLGSADLYRNSDFNDVTAGARVGPEFKLRNLRLSVNAGFYRRRFGGKPLSDIATLQADAVQALGPTTQGRISLAASKVAYRLNDLQDGWTYSLSTQVDQALGRSTGLGLLTGINRQELRARGYSSWSGQAGLYGWRQLGRATLSASALVGHLVADDRLFLYPERRDEWSRRFSVQLTARQATLLGFAPTVQVTRDANRSTIEIYDYRRIAFEAGITRAF